MANICVFAGSSGKIRNRRFYEAARDLGILIGERRHTLVYGGSERGLMGAVASSALKNGAKIIEVIPRIFANAATGRGEVMVTEDLRDRKAKMWEISDGFVALPGGFGTLDEIADVIASAVLANEQQRQVKPLAILNTEGFYDSLGSYFERMYNELFAPQDNRKIYSLVGVPARAIKFVEDYVSPIMESKVNFIDEK